MKRSYMDYTLLINEALGVAGYADQHWNERFTSALLKRGLEITVTVREITPAEYPDGYPYTAPLCYGDNDGWPEGSLIVWRD